MLEKFLQRRDDISVDQLGRNARLLYGSFLGAWTVAMGLLVAALIMDINADILLIVGLVSLVNLVMAHDVRREYWRRKDLEA